MKPWRLDSSANPKGILASSPGLAYHAYPGTACQHVHNPNGVAATRSPGMPQPRWGWPMPGVVPKVGARARQPWALGRNPVGIGGGLRLESVARRGIEVGTQLEGNIPDEEYEVYEAVLTQRFGDPDRQQFVLGEQFGTLMVTWRDRKLVTGLEPGQKLSPLGLTIPCAEDYVRKIADPRRLENRFKLGVPCRVLTEEESAGIWNRGDERRQQGGSLDGWKVFRERYPGALELIRLTRVGFDPERTQAVLTVGYQRDWRGGSGSRLLLSRVEDEWKISGDLGLWLS